MRRRDKTEKTNSERIQDKNNPRPKSSFVCSKTGHTQEDYWFVQNNKRKNSGKLSTSMKNPYYKNEHARIFKERSTVSKVSALSTNEALIIEENIS